MPHVDPSFPVPPSAGAAAPAALFRALFAEAANGVPAAEPHALQSWVDATIDALFARAA